MTGALTMQDLMEMQKMVAAAVALLSKEGVAAELDRIGKASAELETKLQVARTVDEVNAYADKVRVILKEEADSAKAREEALAARELELKNEAASLETRASEIAVREASATSRTQIVQKSETDLQASWEAFRRAKAEAEREADAARQRLVDRENAVAKKEKDLAARVEAVSKMVRMGG